MRSFARTLALTTAAWLLTACAGAPPLDEPPPIDPLASPPPPEKTTFEPARGVVCDRATERCKFRGGVTVGITRLFFGREAAAAIEPAARANHYAHDPIFKPNWRISCDTLVTTCYDGSDGGAPSAEVTERYFGEHAASMLDERVATDIVRYGDHVACDRASATCFDRLGAGVGVTRLYLGKPEADALLDRLRRR